MFPIFPGERSRPTYMLTKNCSMSVKEGECNTTEVLIKQAVSFPKIPQLSAQQHI